MPLIVQRSIEFATARTQQSTVLDSSRATIAQLGSQWGGELNDPAGDITLQVNTGDVGIDGTEATGQFPNNQGLIRFDLTGILPAGAILQQARLVTVTGGGNAASNDTNNISAGIAVRQMLVDWDLDATDATLATLPSEFGTTWGIQDSEGEASSRFVDMNGNFFDGTSRSNAGFDALDVGEEYVFDVTGIVENWLDGDANYGFVINKRGTDGWAFAASGVQLQLDYTTAVVPEPTSLALTSLAFIGIGTLLRLRAKLSAA